MEKNRGLWLWVMLLVSVSLISVAGMRLVFGNQVHETALVKAQTAYEWLKGCGIHWKNLFFFMLVAIPGMAILTRMIAWYAEQFKMPSSQKRAKEIEFIDESPVKPYTTYEEYMKDLTGDVDLEHFLARCRAGVPHEMMKLRLEADRKAKEEADRKARKEAHDRIWDEGRRNLESQILGSFQKTSEIGLPGPQINKRVE